MIIKICTIPFYISEPPLNQLLENKTEQNKAKECLSIRGVGIPHFHLIFSHGAHHSRPNTHLWIPSADPNSLPTD